VAHCLRRFQTVCLSRSLMLLYLIYPGVSGVIIQTFNCVTLPSGASYLVADVRQRCWTTTHWRFVAGAVVWVILIPIGIPASFAALLLYFRVPQIARVRVANAWLRCAVEHAWCIGLPQPPVDAATLGFDSISDEHLELLVSRLVLGETSDDGKPSSPTASDAVPAEPAAHKRSCWQRLVSGGGGDASSSVRLSSRRVILEKSLLLWCRTSGVLSLPPLVWSEAEEDSAQDVHEAAAHDAKKLRGIFGGWSTTGLAATPAAQVMALEQRALRKIAFLFEAYKVDFFYWEIVELLRKLLLTSILALARS